MRPGVNSLCYGYMWDLSHVLWVRQRFMPQAETCLDVGQQFAASRPHSPTRNIYNLIEDGDLTNMAKLNPSRHHLNSAMHLYIKKAFCR